MFPVWYMEFSLVSRQSFPLARAARADVLASATVMRIANVISTSLFILVFLLS